MTRLNSDFTILTNYVYKYHPQLLYLYNLGDECTDITGGWIVSQSGYATCVKHDDHITQTVNGGLSLATIETANDINFDNYRHLIVELVSTASGTYGCNLIVSLSAFSFSSPETKDTYENIDVDLTTGGAPGKVIISTRGGGVSISGNRYRNTVISRIWLIPK